jgi:Na(+)-translocating NADH:ubiquinone oxidoreductase A subunit
MKFAGGYNILLEGRPPVELTGHSAPEVLYLPLFASGLDFSALRVGNGDSVTQGQILAEDPINYFVPLLAPMNGTVNLNVAERHITLENLSGTTDTPSDEPVKKTNPQDRLPALLRFGVWSFMAKVANGRIPDPETKPEALIIPITRSEPFFPSPEIFLKDNIDRFIEGLKLIHKTLCGVDAHVEVKTHVVFPADMSNRASKLRQTIRERADWVELIEVPNKYPNENPALIAHLLGINPGSAWTLEAQAVLGAEQALNHGRPYITRVVSIGGPAAKRPTHARVPNGYPLSLLLDQDDAREKIRLIDGGVLTGRAIEAEQRGLDAACVALTILQENTKREVLAYAKAGFDKQSYSHSFASILKPFFRERINTAMRGESRPCVFCGHCEDICPAGLIPHVIYRYLSNEREEDAYHVGFDQCIECGLCSYVCLSKIEHLKIFLEEKKKSGTVSVDG